MNKKTAKSPAAIFVKTWVGEVLGKNKTEASIDRAKKIQAKEVAELLASFIAEAKNTLSIAIYDFRLEEPEAGIVINAINKSADAGVLVRLAYFQPPAKKAGDQSKFLASGADPAPSPNQDFLGRFSASVKKKPILEGDVKAIAESVHKEPIDGRGHLMHSKYVIVDGMSPAGAVWTGSANFTTDAWSVQDNNIVIVRSQYLAGYYSTDFNELWDAKRITGTGKDDLGTAQVGDVSIDVAFSPGEGATIDHGIAGHISAAQNKVVIASMVISSANVLGALQDALDRGVRITGIYDGPEMAMVANDWKKGATGAAKLAQWKTVSSHLIEKKSLPYTDGGVHNFMHNKCMVVDGKIVVTGSFNFSQSATHNAENVLTLHDDAIASQYEIYINELIKTYR